MLTHSRYSGMLTQLRGIYLGKQPSLALRTFLLAFTLPAAQLELTNKQPCFHTYYHSNKRNRISQKEESLRALYQWYRCQQESNQCQQESMADNQPHMSTFSPITSPPSFFLLPSTFLLAYSIRSSTWLTHIPFRISSILLN